MSSSSEEEDALLAQIRAPWPEERRFFSRLGKGDRERWTVDAFLKGMSIDFVSEELCSLPEESKVDVEFRSARFQVKEIPNPDTRRNDEVKETYRRVMAARTLQETIGPGFVYDVPRPISGYDLVIKSAREQSLNDKYLETKRSLDLLFYVTRTRTSAIDPREIRSEDLRALGWRSVSCLIGDLAFVLYAADDAPEFLQI